MERLDTTNIILTVLAIASVVQTIVVVAVAVGVRRAYRAAAARAESTLVPTLARLESVLINLEQTTAVVRTRADDMSRALDSVQHTAGRLGAAMWPRAAMVAGVAGGVLSAMKRWRAARRAQPHGTVVAG